MVWVRVGSVPHRERALCCCVPLSVYLACPCNDRDICKTTTAAATLSHSVSFCLFVLQALQCKRLLLHTMAAISSSLCRFVCSSRVTTEGKLPHKPPFPISFFLCLCSPGSIALGMCELPVQRLHCLLFFPSLYVISSFRQHYNHTKTLLLSLCLCF